MSIIKLEINQKSIEQKVKEAAAQKIKTTNFYINCPKCNAVITAISGNAQCPFCKTMITLDTSSVNL